MYPAYVYAYPFDFSADYAELLKVKADPEAPVPRELFEIIRKTTGDDWRLGVEGEYSLLGATVVYSGANHSTMLSNSNYTNLIQIQLSGSCTALEGLLIIQFNVPEQK